MPLPVLSSRAIDQLRSDHNALRQLLAMQQTRLRMMQSELGGASNVRVARASVIIPGRNTTTGVAGGPVPVVLQYLDNSNAFQDGDTIDLYSWVKTDSADPDLEDGGELFVFVAQDPDGIWWFIGQDCTKPAISQTSGFLLANYDVPLGFSEVPDTRITAPTWVGWYTYTIEAELNVQNVPGLQAWDVNIGLYDVTDAAMIREWHWAGSGDQLTNPTLSLTVSTEINSVAGHELAMGVTKNLDTGQIILQAPNVTGHELTGPI